MNPEQYFIHNPRRLLGDSSPVSYVYRHRYLSLSFEIIITFVVVLFFVLLISIFYNCYWSRSSRFPGHHASAPRKANHDKLEAIPVFTYGAMPWPSSSTMSSESEICTICLDEYVQEDIVRVLPRCSHMFHKDCIDQWLLKRSFRCPICRDSTIVQSVEITGTFQGYGAAVGNHTFPLVSITFANNGERPSNL